MYPMGRSERNWYCGKSFLNDPSVPLVQARPDLLERDLRPTAKEHGKVLVGHGVLVVDDSDFLHVRAVSLETLRTRSQREL